ncbi:hypothetical protein Clacol_000795 [Clathrus columnatus]|uniref:Uncharacterized protein n=1 Tax=Clathrus columnatus TaxID=1419009 RepID=A0AAV4ZX72_9AGAM|nr:hypothetical protein Clacol_000795 [Clathrus columnatus]
MTISDSSRIDYQRPEPGVGIITRNRQHTQKVAQTQDSEDTDVAAGDTKATVYMSESQISTPGTL